MAVSRKLKALGFGAVAALGVVAGSAPAQAAPPPHAPAHGWRAKQSGYGYDRYDTGYYYSDRSWRNDGWVRGRRPSVRVGSANPLSRWGDFDRDGIPNVYDRDIDNDGIRNERDRNNFSRGRFGGVFNGRRDSDRYDRYDDGRYDDRYDRDDDRYDDDRDDRPRRR